MNSPKKTARIAGILYLIIIICAGFSQGYVRESLIVPGDATTTAHNIIASEWLFRVGFVSDLIAFLCDLIISVLFYILLKPVNKTLALIAAFSRLLAHPAIASINLLNHFIALQFLSGADYLSVFQADQLNAFALLFLDMHKYGYLIGGAFFGLHLFFLGYLLFKSELFPSILGILIALAALGYVIESFGKFLFPASEDLFTWIVAVPAVIGELSLTLWLLIKGVKNPS
ncbi:MAG: DUF4386 domain-containing protein [Saprospiraceae bacterium]|nr:DUF4386 domain-containing protein [Saprospiraceae bacterium]